MTSPIARLEGVTKRFGSVTALDGASLEIRAGEVHGVLGANGAGKSTLLGVLGGMLRPDAGRVLVAGTEVSLDSPRDAWRHGISLVHQHFTLVPALTVVENLALGLRHDPGGARAGPVGGEGSRGLGTRLRRSLSLDLEAVRTEAAALARRTGLGVPLGETVRRLGVGDRQRTEILKALLRDPRILVLDEPTAVLTPDETDGLFELLRDLADDGRAVVLVAHKLGEVLAVSARLTVLRGGRTVLAAAVGETSPTELLHAMVGGAGEGAGLGELRRAAPAVDPGSVEGSRPVPDDASSAASVVARLRGVRLRSGRGAIALDGVDLEIRRGEIVGVAGVEGNGQQELALLLAGRVEPGAGVAELPPAIGFVPQDRTTEGLVADFDLAENVALALHRETAYRSGPWLRWPELRAKAEELRSTYGIAAPSVATRAGALSGGNQQRVVVARELAMAGDLLVAENPTRGLDVVATRFVHARLRELAAGGREGPGIALVSTDLDEVLALSDRVFAMSRGRLRPVPPEARTREGVGALMLAIEDG